MQWFSIKIRNQSKYITFYVKHNRRNPNDRDVWFAGFRVLTIDFSLCMFWHFCLLLPLLVAYIFCVLLFDFADCICWCPAYAILFSFGCMTFIWHGWINLYVWHIILDDTTARVCYRIISWEKWVVQHLIMHVLKRSSQEVGYVLLEFFFILLFTLDCNSPRVTFPHTSQPWLSSSADAWH